jgi:predicted outer membrane protein
MLSQLIATTIAAKFAKGVKARAAYAAAWDEELIAREIKTHREAIALYEDKANGSDAQLRAFARHILPHLQQHLALLESLQSENRHARR